MTRDDHPAPSKPSGRIVGRWSVESGRLCVKGTGLAHTGNRCFTITKNGYSRREYATIDGEGVVWQLFIFQRSGLASIEGR